MSTILPAKVYLMFTLDVLKIARNKLIRDFFKKNPKLYKSMYKYGYHDSQALLELSIEQYFTEWLDQHWQIMNDRLASLEIEPLTQQEFKSVFASAYLQLLQRHHLIHEQAHSENVDLMKHLLIQKIHHMKEILRMSERDEERWDVIETDIEKHRKIFRDKMKQFTEEKK